MYGDFASNVQHQLEILASLDAIVYVCDVENYRVLYASPYAQKVLGVRQGDKCFEGIYGNDQVCSFCSDQDLLDEQGQPTGFIYSERYNPKAGRWFECRTRALELSSGQMVRLEMAFDITDRIQLRNQLANQNEYYHTVLNSIGDAVIITDKQGYVTWMNPRAQELTAWERDDAIGKPLEEVFCIVHTKTRQPCRDPVSKVLQTGKVVGLANHTSLLARDGTEYQIADSAAPVRDDAGVVFGVILVFHDVTEDYLQQEQLRQSEQRFRGLFQYSINAIALHEIICDENGVPVDYRFLTVNEAFEEMTGLRAQDIIGRTVLEVLPGTESVWIEKYGHVALAGASLEFEEYSQEIDRYYSVRAYSPRPNQFVTVFYDITKRKEMEKSLRELVFLDALTGLYNRRYFEQELQRIDNETNLPLSIIMGDVNGLKIINDSMGHQQGDLVLESVGRVLRRVSRPGDLVSRWGGDEFLMVLPNTTPAEAEEICFRIEETIKVLGDEEMLPSIALGCATKTVIHEEIQNMIREAENRMYQHKMNNAESSRSTLVASLQRTLAEKSHETDEHARHLQSLGLALGRRMGVSDAELDEISLVAILHDIGKVAIPESVLDKPGPLTNEEWEIMKRHCEIGYRIVASSPDLIGVAEGVLSHHERWDGRGYPRGLKGEEIPLTARIITIVDAFDAMTTNRAYRKRITEKEALAEIEANKGSQFDPELAQEFIAMMNEMKQL